MPGIKISDLTSVTPLSTDIVVLDRPTVGAGAPVTGKATVAALAAAIGGGGGGGDVFWTSPAADVVETTGSIRMDTSTTAGSYAVAVGKSTDASGNSSFAQGGNTTASGNGSHAEGASTIASGIASHAEGSSTIASGSHSHAEGYITTASGYASHTEGSNTIASEAYSHAEGSNTIASGYASHAEGESTTASGGYSHAEGTSTTASGGYSHAEGSGTTASGYVSHAEGVQTQTGRLGFYFNTGVSDGVDPNNWVFELEPQYSDITGGNFPSYIGSDLIVNDTNDPGPKRYLLVGINYDGTNNHVTASDAYGMGVYPVGSGELAGFDFDSGLNFENAPMGGTAAHSEGVRDFQSGDINGYAYGNYSHSEGYGTIAFNNYSHSEGERTRALGIGSHAEGYYTVASGSYSHAEGVGTTATGYGSHAEGIYTIASGSGQLASGKYNLRNNDFSLFVIGDGTGDSNATRGDIFRVNSGSTPGTGRVEVTGSLSITTGVTGTLFYSASNATDWSGNAPLTVQDALDRIAAALGPIA